MILQLEDCVDVLQNLYPNFDFKFIFDHSNGHDRLQSNGLSLSKINIKHGRKQPKMRSSKLQPEHFGPFHDSNYELQLGMTQTMVYSPTDKGPCYMTPEQHVTHRYDIDTGKERTKELTVSQLISNLKSIGIPDPKGLKPTLQSLCTRNNLPLTSTDDVIIKGWVHKPKGAIQILYEHGWLNPDHLHLYTGDGRKTNDKIVSGHTDPTRCMFSVNKLMKKQTDFINEVTLLQLHTEKIGVSIDRSPKCHPELAGKKGLNICGLWQNSFIEGLLFQVREQKQNLSN